MTINCGNLDIEVGDQSITMRLRHVVQGHPGHVMGINAIPAFVAKLESIVRRAKATRYDMSLQPVMPFTGADEDDDLIG
jgi:hypothetical protein